MSRTVTALSIILALTAMHVAKAAKFTTFSNVSAVTTIANDGTVAGFGYLSHLCDNNDCAYLWTESDGFLIYPFLPGYPNHPLLAFSDDGDTQFGYLWNSATESSFVAWNWRTGVAEYAPAPNLSTASNWQVTPDFSVAAWHNTRWTPAGGEQPLGLLPGEPDYSETIVEGLSSDGAVIAGTASRPGEYAGKAFIWTEATRMVDLGRLPGTETCDVRALSADGSSVVGGCDTLGASFRWTAETGMELMPGMSDPQFVSEDGGIVLGYSFTPEKAYMAIWDKAHGTRTFEELAVDLGFELPPNVTFDNVFSGFLTMSPNGRYVGGSANWDSIFPGVRDWGGFLLDLGPPTAPGDTNNDGRVDIVDLNNVRNHFGEQNAAGDTNGDSHVDIVDLNNVRNHFGESTAGSAVPEPGGLLLTLVTLLALAGTVGRCRS